MPLKNNDINIIHSITLQHNIIYSNCTLTKHSSTEQFNKATQKYITNLLLSLLLFHSTENI